jgi:peptide deformylase
MYETLKKHEGVGIAAVQVGILRRVIVIDLDDELIEMINPEIIQRRGTQSELEGCLSYPGKWGYVERPAYVKISSKNRYGKPQTHEADDLLAVAFCHELDHLDGIMFSDVADELLDREPSEEERQRRAKKMRRRRRR